MNKFEGKVSVLENYICIQTEGSRAGYPHFLVRTSGCTHRCHFGEGGWCDSWQTSVVLEKPTWTWGEIIASFKERPDINHLMITGGSPTMHFNFVNALVTYFKELKGKQEDGSVDESKSFITIETEGSHFVQTDYKIDLISLSPKFSNSVPKLGIQLPGESSRTVDQKLIDQHNKFRMNHQAISQMLSYHKDYHFKPVVDKNDTDIWDAIEEFRNEHNIPKNKTWVMPAGGTREELLPNYPYVLEECTNRGYNFTGRPHIVAFGDKRFV